MIDYACPKCKTPMSSPDSMAGLLETCPKCGTVIKVLSSEELFMLQMENPTNNNSPIKQLVGKIEKGAGGSIEKGTTLGLRIPLWEGFVNG